MKWSSFNREFSHSLDFIARKAILSRFAEFFMKKEAGLSLNRSLNLNFKFKFNSIQLQEVEKSVRNPKVQNPKFKVNIAELDRSKSLSNLRQNIRFRRSSQPSNPDPSYNPSNNPVKMCKVKSV